ncbi:MAG: molybdopterin-dependent oxidoreductase [Bacteroidales bacterium]|nr:molybdopterin-dependent oxidoreductase [Bacteroidales bacterium]
MKVFTTACPRNCYSTCSFKVHVDKGRIVNFEPNPENLATAEGICLKGLSYKERVYSEKRILSPLQADGRGGFQRISWDKALCLIAEKLSLFREKYGSKSVFFYESSGMSGLLNEISSLFWRNYGGVTTSYGNLCWPAGLEAVRLTLGENKHNVPWDLENARLIIMWGKNAVETNIQESIPLEKALENGAKLVVIDPRRTATAEKASLLIQPRPGTDAALALGIARILVETEAIDSDFISEYVLGYDQFRESLQQYTDTFVEEVTGVPVKYIHKLAHLIGEIKPMTIIPGYGMQRYTNGGQTVRCILSLQIITGNIGKPGACFHYANLQSYIFDKIPEPLSYYPEIAHDGVSRRNISKAKLGKDMLSQKDPELKMIWVERGNPVTQNPDTNQIVKAFRKLEFIVVVDQFMTDTAKEADIILPAKTMFEQSDIIGSYWNPYVQLKQKVIDPPGEVKPETEIYSLLWEKLGFRKEVTNFIPENTDEAIDNWLAKKLQPFPGLSLDKLRNGPVMAPGLQKIAFSNYVFRTPSGKIELLSVQAHEKWGVDELPSFQFTEENMVKGPYKDKAAFYFLTPNTKNRIHSQFGNLDVIRQFDPEPLLEINPEDAMAAGIKNGEEAKIFNERGTLVLKFSYNYGMRKGCLSLANGWWLSEGGGGNLLSAPRETDMGHGTAFHDNLVFIEKIKQEQG